MKPCYLGMIIRYYKNKVFRIWWEKFYYLRTLWQDSLFDMVLNMLWMPDNIQELVWKVVGSCANVCRQSVDNFWQLTTENRLLRQICSHSVVNSSITATVLQLLHYSCFVTATLLHVFCYSSFVTATLLQPLCYSCSISAVFWSGC